MAFMLKINGTPHEVDVDLSRWMSALPPLGDEAQEVAVSQRSLASMTSRVKCGLTREEGQQEIQILLFERRHFFFDIRASDAPPSEP